MHNSASHSINDEDRDLCRIISLAGHNCKHVLVQVLVQQLTILTVVSRQEVFLLASGRLLVVLGLDALDLIVLSKV